MVKQVEFVIFFLFVVAIQLHTAMTEHTRKTNNTEEQSVKHQNLQRTGNIATRKGRIMRVLKEPVPPMKRNHIPQSPQLQLQLHRDSYQLNQQRPQPINHYRPFFSNTRKQILRRVQNGAPLNTILRHQQTFNYDPAKLTRNVQGTKEAIPPPNFGKSTVYRPQFSNGPHPNALTKQGHSQQYLQNFKASPQYNGDAIVRPLQQEIKQYPLPQQHPQHQLPIINEHPNRNTAPQIFPTVNQPLTQQTEAFVESTRNVAPGALQTYSVYEDPENSEHAPLQYNSQQNALTFNGNVPTPTKQVTPAVEEAENYLKFMSTNDYFLPKLNPNYKKLDEENDLRLYKQQKNKLQQYQPQQQFGKTLPTSDVVPSTKFQTPIQVSKLFYHEDPLASSTIVRGSYQTGNNAFVVNSFGNKAIKHIVPQDTIPPSNIHFNSQRQHTPEPMRFEFTERDAVPAAPTKSPSINSHLHKQNIGSQPISPLFFATSSTPVYGINHNHPIAVNEVDADPEDGDDMQEAGTDFFGRVPIRSSTEIPQQEDSSKSISSTPATQQTDTEEYCEHMCANVQDEDVEVVCGSDGYMYTGEAQMECYASCLHIDVTIQGKGSCSAR